MKNITRPDSLYKKTAEQMYGSLIASNTSAGAKLLPIKTLAKNFNTSYLTIQRAVGHLQKEGVVISRRGTGTYVTEKIEDENLNKKFYSRAVSLQFDGSIEIVESSANRSRSIGIIFPCWMREHGEFAYHKIERGFLNSIDTLNWRVEMINNYSHQASNPDFIDSIIEKKIDGVLWLSPQIEHKMNIMRLIDHNIFVVGVGRVFPELPFKSVFMDFEDLAEKIVQKYWMPGKKAVLLVGPAGGLLHDENSCRFVEQIKQALLRRNYCLSEDNIGKTAIFIPGCKELEKLTIDFLSRHHDADIIICYHEEFLSAIEKLDAKDFWKTPAPVILSVNADFGLRLNKAGRIPVNIINLPLADFGAAAAHEFKQKWTAEPLEPFDGALLRPQI